MEELLTTRQLQELLRVDRITIYRMLSDGRLRGFKVGGQWRFPLREIDAWLHEQQGSRAVLAPPPAADGAPTARVLPLTCIQAIQGVCAEAMQVAAVTTDLEGVPLAALSNSCAFCDLVLSTPRGRERCAVSWRQAADGQIRACHAGLLCASAAISVSGQPVALAAVCQFTFLSRDCVQPAWLERLPRLALDLGLEEGLLEAAAGGVRSIPDDHLPRLASLVRRVAATFSEIGQERLSLLSRLQSIAEMSRI